MAQKPQFTKDQLKGLQALHDGLRSLTTGFDNINRLPKGGAKFQKAYVALHEVLKSNGFESSQRMKSPKYVG
jgi:hypothetical protein